ncbi:unnamed protein product, partial [Rotaria sordida]
QAINDDKNNQQVGQNVPPPLLNDNNSNVQQLNHLELNSRSKEKHSFLYFVF